MPSQSNYTMTLQQVYEAIASLESAPPEKRVELRSAIRRFAEICNINMSSTPADGPSIRAAAKTASWQLAGLTKNSWANVMYRVTKALGLAGVNVHRRRQYRPSPEWTTLADRCGANARHGLTRFAGWCTTLGIAPCEVTAETFEKYQDYLIEFSTVGNPRERWHGSRRAWNRYVVGADAVFPYVPNNEPDGWRGLPLSEFPESLRAGFASWRAQMLNSDPFATGEKDRLKLTAPHRALKEVTAKGYIDSLRCAASRMIDAGDAPVTQFASLEAFVDPSTAKAALRRLLGDRDFDQARPAMHALMTATLSLAGYLNVTGERLEELKRLASRVRNRPTGMCERNKTRLQPFKDKEVLRRFVCLPMVIAKRLQNINSPTIAEARLMQMAVLLELMFHVPMRVKNAASLDLAEHFQLPVAGKAGRWRIHIAKGEVKNDKAIDAELSLASSALFERYVAVFHPKLCKGQSTSLFVSQSGAPKGSIALAAQFRKFVGRELGLVVNIHLMRHLVAFAYLEANPGDYEGARQLLGHKQITTTINFYAGAESAAAFRRLDDIVDRMRDVVLDEKTGEPKVLDYEVL